MKGKSVKKISAVFFGTMMLLGTAMASYELKYEARFETQTVSTSNSKAEQTRVPELIFNPESIAGKADGTITGLTTEMEYSLDYGLTYNKVVNPEMTFAPGEVYVRYAATDSYLAGQAVSGVIEAGEKLSATFEIRHNLNLLDLVQIGYWFTATPDIDGVEFIDYGILIWDEEAYLTETDFTVTSENAYKPEISLRAGYQMGYGEGVYAQYLDTKYYAIPYALTSEGDYVYCKTPDVYSIPIYATEDGFKNTTDSELETVVHDLLNYATYAQYYFYERDTDIDISTLNPINSVLEIKDRVNRYDSSMLVEEHEISKNTTMSLECTWLYTTANLEEAISLNFFAEQNNSFSGMLYWNSSDYKSAKSLIYATKTGKNSVTDRVFGGVETTTGSITNIYPKEMSEPQYVCMYNYTDGIYTYGEIKVDSVAAYLTRAINATDEMSSDLNFYFETMCKAMLAYGDSAKAYAE